MGEVIAYFGRTFVVIYSKPLTFDEGLQLDQELSLRAHYVDIHFPGLGDRIVDVALQLDQKPNRPVGEALSISFALHLCANDPSLPI